MKTKTSLFACALFLAPPYIPALAVKCGVNSFCTWLHFYYFMLVTVIPLHHLHIRGAYSGMQLYHYNDDNFIIYVWLLISFFQITNLQEIKKKLFLIDKFYRLQCFCVTMLFNRVICMKNWFKFVFIVLVTPITTVLLEQCIILSQTN